VKRAVFPISVGIAVLAAVLALNVSWAAQHPQARHASAPRISFGPSHSLTLWAFNAYYDGHLDEYINTDVSSKSQARRFGLNHAPVLHGTAPKATSPEYFVVGRHAAGQLAVFGSEPPDPAYSPLWQEFIVKWKAMAKPVVLTSDNEIFAMQKKGELTLRKTQIVINAPITKVGH
jgi:hypothetical protein